MFLDEGSFQDVVASTPLVSIDLVVQNSEGEILLGQRLNRPAQGFWFVPGGRILKNEKLDAAFRRLTLQELGQIFERRHARLLGVYEHFYADSVFAEAGLGPDTHYVTLGYQLILPEQQVLEPPRNQHEHYSWWPMRDMQGSGEVHNNSRAYLDALH